jgi:hypothetical protein
MPSYIDTLTEEEERWDVAAYVRSLIRKPPARGEPVVRSKRIDRDLPLAPDDPLWQEAEALDVPLSGQVVVAPRWQNHSVDLITVRSLYNENAIAFLLEWDDRFKDTVHKDEPLPEGDTYAKFDPEKEWTLRDAIEIQFPVRIPEGIERPYFFLGQPEGRLERKRGPEDTGEGAVCHGPTKTHRPSARRRTGGYGKGCMEGWTLAGRDDEAVSGQGPG